MEKDRWKGLFRPENKKMRQSMLLLLLLGILLLALGRTASKEERLPLQEAVKAGRAEAETERRMAELLSGVDGAGAVDVMLTYCRSGEKTVARNETAESDGDALRTEESVVLLEDKNGSTAPLILEEASPAVEGAVIVAQGADSPAVAAALHQAAQALLDVPAHKIAVLKMK